YMLFSAGAHQRPLAAAGVRHLGELAADAYRAAHLQVDPDGATRWHWSSAQLETVRHVAVSSGVELLTGGPSPRLKQCPGDHCGWFFLDATKRGNRRWCQMSECGQEAKDQRRREKRRR
ncbi:MAG: CGNR zinc finger domain-containing protein, partial [Solirubrobacteraceae bacterium]